MHSYIIQFPVRYIISMTDTDQFFSWPSGSVKYILWVCSHFRLPWNLVCMFCFLFFLIDCFLKTRHFWKDLESNFLITPPAPCILKLCFFFFPLEGLALEMHCTLLCVNNKQRSCHTSAVCAFVTANNMQTHAACVKIRCQSRAPWLPHARASRQLPGLKSTAPGCTEYSSWMFRAQGRRGRRKQMKVVFFIQPWTLHSGKSVQAQIGLINTWR